jgi:hypothetical protein
MGGEIIAVAWIILPVVLVPTIIAMKHANRKREWEHLERMKALELGQPIPRNDTWWALGSMAIGAGVPVGAMFCAWMASLTTKLGDHAWPAAAVLGVTGIIGGIKLGKCRFASRPAQRGLADVANGKPYAADPDAYDVVSRRG